MHADEQRDREHRKQVVDAGGCWLAARKLTRRSPDRASAVQDEREHLRAGAGTVSEGGVRVGDQ